MRRGPNYMQMVDRTPDGDPSLRPPIELVHDFEDVEFVRWTENDNGTYTLTVYDKHVDKLT